MWTSPSSLTPISTKAPKSTTFRTTPVNFILGFRSSSFRIPFLNCGLGSSRRGSRPGFLRFSMISWRVGSPIWSSCASCGSWSWESFSGIWD